MDPEEADVTQLLADIRSGDPAAMSHLMGRVYEPLRAMAGRCFRSHPDGHTLQPTELVHEVFLRMTGKTDAQWHDRAHFLAVCATVMRDILVDHARRRRALKRGGGMQRVTLAGNAAKMEDFDALDLDNVLTRLAAVDERQAKIVEYRFFAGMTISEAAHALGVSARTVNDDWAMARAWISAQLSKER
ncbi:MAG: sigma-70 family RNA polymerase sigma factor [bacterium]|nr:sigma-70 family RNA polymerase sigma factor [bacterium]